MKREEYIAVFDKYKVLYNDQMYRYVDEIFSEIHKNFLIALSVGKDEGQAWKSVSGKGLELFIEYIITKDVLSLGLGIIHGNELERASEANISDFRSVLKRKLLINFGGNLYFFPDVDLVIYEPKKNNVIALVSSKASLRERIAQSGYWKFKLNESDNTNHIKLFMITPDKDNIFGIESKMTKSRAIAETAIDGSYIITSKQIKESSRVKYFDHFFTDLKKIIKPK